MRRCRTRRAKLSLTRSGSSESNGIPRMRTVQALSPVKFASRVACAILLAASFSLAGPAGDLASVLRQMDDAAAKFRTTEASFAWTQYNKVIDDVTETQEGKIYFRRAGNETQMAADIMQPSAKLV